MGQEPRSMTAGPEKPELEVTKLEREIGATRERLGVYLSELDRRRPRFARAFKRICLALLGGGALAGVVAIYFKIRSNDN